MEDIERRMRREVAGNDAAGGNHRGDCPPVTWLQAAQMRGSRNGTCCGSGEGLSAKAWKRCWNGAEEGPCAAAEARLWNCGSGSSARYMHRCGAFYEQVTEKHQVKFS